MAEYLEIAGKVPLVGRVKVSGAKNAVLPLLIASLLTSEKCEFTNVPNLSDVNLILQLLEHFGGHVTHHSGEVSVEVPSLSATEASYSLVKALRGSFWVLAPLLARGRAARVALPGGDIIGARPVDIHLAGLQQMGAEIKVSHGTVFATAINGLKPTRFEMRFPSVGATHQLIMAASLTQGTTVLVGAAREPEIVALASLINEMGGDIEGAGSETVIIRGKEELGGARVSIIGDRIEAGTYLLAALATSGNLIVEGVSAEFFGEFLDILNDIGADLVTEEDSIAIKRRSDFLNSLNIKTGPFPKFATDLQPQLMATLCLARGESTLEESIYEGRFAHVSELCRMGAKIQVSDRIAKIQGIDSFDGAQVEGHDIRAAAGLVIAGLSADGITQIFEPSHLRRGYDRLEEKLRSLGANVGSRLSDAEDYMFTGC